MFEVCEEFAVGEPWDALIGKGEKLSDVFYGAAMAMKERQIVDVHFELRDKTCAHLRAYHGKKRPDYARMDGGGTAACSSCHPELPLSALLKVLPRKEGAKDPLDEIHNSALLLATTAHSRLWIDGKGRPIIVATPIKHVETMGELTREESVQLWSDLSATLLRVLPHDKKKSSIKSFMVNHGTRQNHPHLHIKVNVRRSSFSSILTEQHHEAFAATKKGVALARKEGRLGLSANKKKLEKFESLKAGDEH